MDLESLIHRRNELQLIYNKLYADLSRADSLMRQVGFTNGIETVKLTVEELFKDGEDLEDNKAA